MQIIHTNSGTLGQISLTGSLDLCINGGRLQPFCRRGLALSNYRCGPSVPTRHDNPVIEPFTNSFPFSLLCLILLVDRNRCSHFLSVCYLANAIFKHKLFPYRPCPHGCIANNAPLFGKSRYSYKNSYSSLVRLMHIGQDVPEE